MGGSRTAPDMAFFIKKSENIFAQFEGLAIRYYVHGANAVTHNNLIGRQGICGFLTFSGRNEEYI